MNVLTAPVRTPPPYWTGVLRRAFGEPNAHLAWLELAWHPTWERWIIYQVVPPGRTNFFVQQEAVEGSPLLNLDLDLLDIGQVQLYLRSGCYGSVLWVIQGTNGGHRRRWWPYEQALASLKGLPERLPDPGELCYAEMDWRVMEQLHQLDRVAKWNMMLEYCDRHEAELEPGEMQARLELKQRLLGWVTDQVSNVFESAPDSIIRGALDELPHGISRRGVTEDHRAWLEKRLTERRVLL